MKIKNLIYIIEISSPANGETDSIEHGKISKTTKKNVYFSFLSNVLSFIKTLAQKTLELLRSHLQGTLHIDVAQLKLIRASAGPLSLGCDGRLKVCFFGERKKAFL